MLLPARPRATTSPSSPPVPTLDEELPLPKWPNINLPIKAATKHKNSLPGLETPPMTEEEFRNLPICIQRKYFSSLERLHIAHSAATTFSNPSPPISPSQKNKSIATDPIDLVDSPHKRQQSAKSLRSITPVLGQPAFGEGHVPRRPSQRVRPQTANAFGDSRDSRTELQWFNSLPDKVRRQHFSSEEQELLASGLDHWVTASRQASKRNSRSSSHRLSQTFASVDCSRVDIDDMDGQLVRAPSQIRDGMKRAFSSFHVPRASVASNATNTLPTAPLIHRRDKSRGGTLIGIARPSVDTTVTVIDPDALYYQSPEARSKLRQYLASPQKFDEALNFGFPSTPTTITTLNSNDDDKDLHKMQPSTASNDAKAFLQHDQISFLDKEGDNVSHGTETSDGDTDSPATPADGDWSWRTSKYNRISIFGGIDTDSMPSLDLKFHPDKFGTPLSKHGKDRSISPIYTSSANSMSTACLPSPGLLSPLASPMMNREMTLRMTLTRPDLRATDDDLYGWQNRDSAQMKRRTESRAGVQEEPLSLSDLQADDATKEKGLKGSRVLFRRMMKRMKRT